jgi:hypothetical protein
MNLERDSARRTALLYTMMIVAAAAVMVFSIIGIATMMEWLPNSSGDARIEPSRTTHEQSVQSRGAIPREALHYPSLHTALPASRRP